MEWKERDGLCWQEAELPGARAAFTTRQSGVSEGAYESLNLGLLTDDSRDHVLANRDRMCSAVGVRPRSVISGRQVHEGEVVRHRVASDPSPWLLGAEGDPLEVDGHATSVPGLAPLVYVADCLPVALVGEGGVAMLHCGWRGLAAGIIERGAREVDATHAAVGPGIGPCCFEVGFEVLAEFAHLGEDVADDRMLDLPKVAERLLGAAGVTDVQHSGLCTYCESDLYFSHRRDDGLTGRQAGLAWLS